VLTGVITPAGVDADALRKLIHDRFDLSLGTGLGKVKGRMFRVGHLGDSNDLTLMAALAGVEMGLKLAGVATTGERCPGGDGLLRLASAARNPSRLRPEPPFSFPELPHEKTPRSPGRCRRAATLGLPAFAPRPGRRAPVRIVVGFPPGGGTDALARVARRRSSPGCGASRSWSRPRPVPPA
jgi:hypothetical protein